MHEAEKGHPAPANFFCSGIVLAGQGAGGGGLADGWKPFAPVK
jgi:hypothetical protein